jgi:histidinol dehydrogenase
MAKAFDNLDADLKESLVQACNRIESYHKKQIEKSWSYKDSLGISLGQKITPVDSVGLYVPGGKASYPSSVLMNAMPAKIAGVKQIIACVPTPKNEINQTVLAALHLVGVDKAFSIGGAQAVGAMAFGSETVPAVNKIVGPGNKYVAEAKKQVFGIVGIDMIAGPSEVLIIADSSSNPDWVAMDMFAQAEHDKDAQSIVISDDISVLNNIKNSIEKLIESQPRKETIISSLKNFGALIKVKNLNEAVEISNQIAPEHLELSLEENTANDVLDKIKHAGAIFVGHYAAESLGDYCFGPNHVLPTSGCAKFSSPLGVYDFIKKTSVIKCNKSQASKIAGIAEKLALSEGLYAHAQSAKFRK